MKLYADIVFRNEQGMEISRVVQEETRQYQGMGLMIIHEFFFDWKVGECYSNLEVINGNENGG